MPVIRLDELTDEQRRAYMLVHNKLTMNTGFDFEILEQELEELNSIDMNEYGFETNLLEDMNYDEFFADSEEKEKEPKKIRCPHCGEWFEV